MYSTSRPCRLCETTSYWARIDRMYFGSMATNAGAPRYLKPLVKSKKLLHSIRLDLRGLGDLGGLLNSPAVSIFLLRGDESVLELIMLDELSLGLAPKLVQVIFDLVVRINRELGMTILLVEQNVGLSCEISNRAFVLENGVVVLQGAGADMLENEHVRQAYLGL